MGIRIIAKETLKYPSLDMQGEDLFLSNNCPDLVWIKKDIEDDKMAKILRLFVKIHE